MILIIFNPHKLPELPREREDVLRKIRINGSFRHTHIERIKGNEFLELENDTEVGKVSLYLDKYELEQLKLQLHPKSIESNNER